MIFVIIILFLIFAYLILEFYKKTTEFYHSDLFK